MKAKQFKTDEWALYHRFYDSKSEALRDSSQPAVILEVLGKRDIYDYRIFIDDGTSTIRKVKEESLFPVQKTK